MELTQQGGQMSEYKVGQEITWDEARQVMKAGGICQMIYDNALWLSDEVCYSEKLGRYKWLHGNELDKSGCLMYDCYFDRKWIITKLPPAPVPTAEELLKEIFEIVQPIIAWKTPSWTDISAADRIIAWREKVRKHLEGK